MKKRSSSPEAFIHNGTLYAVNAVGKNTLPPPHQSGFGIGHGVIVHARKFDVRTLPFGLVRALGIPDEELGYPELRETPGSGWDSRARFFDAMLANLDHREIVILGEPGRLRAALVAWWQKINPHEFMAYETDAAYEGPLAGPDSPARHPWWLWEASGVVWCHEDFQLLSLWPDDSGRATAPDMTERYLTLIRSACGTVRETVEVEISGVPLPSVSLNNHASPLS